MSASTSAIIVDDHGSMTYYPYTAWTDATTSNEKVFNGTLKFATGPDCYASRTFVGTKIQVVGVVQPSALGKPIVPIVSTYILDNQVAGTYTATPGNDEQDGVAFFTSNELNLGSHKLQINITSASDDYPFILDYVMFVPAPTLSQTLALSATSASVSSSSQTAWTDLFPQTPRTVESASPTSSNSQTSSNSGATGTTLPQSNAVAGQSDHTGPIVGGVIGGIGLLIALFALLFWWIRKRRVQGGVKDLSEKGEHSIMPILQPPARPGVTPYLLPRDYSGSSANVVPRETAAPLAPRSVLGSPDAMSPVSSSGKAALIASLHSRNSSSNGLASGSGGRSTPSEVSSTSAAGSTTRLLSSDGSEAAGRAGTSSEKSPRRRPRREKDSMHSMQSSVSPGGNLQPQLPVRADSGRQLPRAPTSDEGMSPVPTGLPPAYTPS